MQGKPAQVVQRKEKREINLSTVSLLLQRETLEDDNIVLIVSSAMLLHYLTTGKPQNHRAPKQGQSLRPCSSTNDRQATTPPAWPETPLESLKTPLEWAGGRAGMQGEVRGPAPPFPKFLQKLFPPLLILQKETHIGITKDA